MKFISHLFHSLFSCSHRWEIVKSFPVRESVWYELEPRYYIADKLKCIKCGETRIKKYDGKDKKDTLQTGTRVLEIRCPL